MKRLTFIVRVGLTLLTTAVWVDLAAGQTPDKRNPLLEFSTGTWCQWCPCGDSLIIKDILPKIPNAIVLAYHGPENYAGEPFSFFAGNNIISSLGFNAYPTGIIDRVTGIISRSDWLARMTARLSLPPTVRIEPVSIKYDSTTRKLDVSMRFTALANLSGQYNYNVLLTENHITYGQSSNNTCTPGTTYLANYVHDWLVRDMMNGALGGTIVNGAWNQNVAFTQNLSYTVPKPKAPAPDIKSKNCKIVVIVYKNGSPLNANAEVQQAEQWPLITPPKRNPVLEFSTGTWCQWCPCGDSLIIKDILPKIPNAIVLAYHGPENYSSEPFSFFAGNNIISSLGFNAYPTGIIDRVTGIISRSDWLARMTARLSLPPTVSIEPVSIKCDTITRKLDVTLRFTALTNLSGQYNYNVLLTEDHITYGQSSNNTCTPGTTYLVNYVHDWLVRDMMNGALGGMIVNGAWNQNVAFTQNLNYTVPKPRSPSPDVIMRRCKLVVLVYKNNSPLNLAEIQQAGKWPLLTTGVEDGRQAEIIGGFELSPNYPNPMHIAAAVPETQISYVLPKNAGKRVVALVIYNQLGQKVRTLVDAPQEAGHHRALWDGRDDQNRPVAAGIYFYQLRVGVNQATRKIVVLR